MYAISKNHAIFVKKICIHNRQMTTQPHCKINIGLNVVAKRPDGYHNLETIFHPVHLCDELSTEEANEDSLEIDGIQLDGDWHENLVMKSLLLLRREGYNIPPQRIYLKKNIPNGAGLGGGSSDASFMMRILNELYSLGLSDTQMEEWLATMGADCPFFIRKEPVFATGIGNIFQPTTINLSGWNLVLVKPDDHISTREAYAGIRPCAPQFSLTEIGKWSIGEWRERVVNDFERSVFPLHPNVARIKQRLYDMGAAYASMSGSGSSVFGLFESSVEGIDNEFRDCFTYQEKIK